MHQRTWLSILTFPVVALFTYPVLFNQNSPGARSEAKQTYQDPLAGLSDIQDVLSLVRDNYVDAPDMEKVIGGGIQAALERAHPLNAYLSAEELRLPDPGPASLGLVVLKKDIVARVMDVIPGSPAAKAGIQTGDVIRKIDGESVGFFSAWALERRMKGAEGSEVSLLNYAAVDGKLKKLTLKREVVKSAPISIRKEGASAVISLPDLAKGRAAELKPILATLDPKGTLVLDLRGCAGGDLDEAALLAGQFAGPGTLATVQEAGKADRAVAVAKAETIPFRRMAVLMGPGTLGAAEALASYLKKQAIPTIGERTAALGVERTRILLKQGGAVELITRRWLGAGSEKLDRQGLDPEYSLKSVTLDEDPLPKVIEILDKREKTPATSGTNKVNSASRGLIQPKSGRSPQGPDSEVA
jgi:carboxyl-terminal processing protease